MYLMTAPPADVERLNMRWTGVSKWDARGRAEPYSSRGSWPSGHQRVATDAEHHRHHHQHSQHCAHHRFPDSSCVRCSVAPISGSAV